MLRKQPIQARSQVTFAAIVDATIQVLLRDGLDKLTTGRVAERAGVSIGTLYQYFGDKTALIAAVRAKHVALLVASAETALSSAESADPRTILRSALRAFLQVKRENLALSRALIGLKGSAAFDDGADDVVARFAAPLAALLPDDAAEPDRTTRATALVAALDGTLAHAVAHAPEWLEQDWFLAFLESLALAALRPCRDPVTGSTPLGPGDRLRWST